MDVITGNRAVFDAVLYPHRSLNQSQFKLLMLIVVSASAFIGFYFTLKGAWPVLGFFGLEILAVYWMFTRNFKDAENHETVRLYKDKLVIEDIYRKQTKQWEFNPNWVQISVKEPEAGRNNGCLNITSHGKGVSIGEFLSEEERLEFKDRLLDALRKVKTARDGLATS